MAFGISFGANKSKSSQTTNVNKTEDVNQTESGTKSSTGTTSTTGSSATTSGSTTNTSQTGTSAQQTTGSQQSTSTTTQFDDAVLGGLNSAVAALLGNIPMETQQLEGSFDHGAFVQSGLDAANSKIQTDLDASLNSVFDAIGGRDDSNSMATLLANRARSDAGAALSGAYANLEAQAQGIERDRFASNLAGIGLNQNFLANVLQQLKGGQATTSGNVQTQENVTGQTSQQGTGTTSGFENTQTAQNQVSNLIEILNSVLKGTTHTTGTESTKAKGTNIGGGVGLSI